MIEPFREWNDSGSRRNDIVANGYFMPCKPTYRPGLVVCQVE